MEMPYDVGVVISDLDGTLSMDHVSLIEAGGRREVSTNYVHPDLYESICSLKDSGLVFGVASGRPRYLIDGFFPETPDLMIAENGLVIQVGDEHYLPDKLYGVDWDRKCSERDLIIRKHESMGYEHVPYRAKTEVRVTYFHPPGDEEGFKKKCEGNVIGEWKANVFNIGGVFLWADYTLPSISKRDGIEFCLGKLKIDPDNVLYLGDGENDLSVFEWSELGYKVAPENALPEIRERADLIIEPPPYGPLKLFKELSSNQNRPKKHAVKEPV